MTADKEVTKIRKARVVYVLLQDYSEGEAVQGIFSSRKLAEDRLNAMVQLHSVSRHDLSITDWKLNE